MMDTATKVKIEEIIKNNPIREVLMKRGHSPVSESLGRVKYLCPFPDHKESQPSFVLYTNGDQDNFWCYGCSRGNNVIHLIAYMDNLPYEEVFSKLGDGITITTDAEQKKTIDLILEDSEVEDKSLEQTMMEISWACLLHLQGCELDSNEIRIVDNYYRILDECLINGNIDKLTDSCRYLYDLLKKRKIIYNDKLKELVKTNYAQSY